MAARASSMPISSAESWQPSPPAPPILASDSWACWPRIRRQRVICVFESSAIGLKFLEVEPSQFVQLLLFHFAQFLAQDLADALFVDPPDFAEVFRNAVFFSGGKVSEGTPQEDQ